MIKNLLVACFLSTTSLFAQTNVFQSDFSNPNDFIIIGNPNTWVIGTAGPQGVTSQNMAAINSTSGGNFALFDSDFFGPGPQYESMTVSTPIDVVSYQYVYACFESYYQRDTNAQVSYDVSNDGGATWNAFPVHTSLLQGDLSSNPESVLIDISVVAGNQPSVLFRFSYGSNVPGFAWMVDNPCMLASNSPISGLYDLPADEQFMVYPNPTTGNFTLDLFSYKSEATITVTDAQGRTVQVINKTGISALEMEISGDAGIYFIAVETEDGRSVSAVVKE